MVGFSKESEYFLIEFHGLDRRLLMLQQMYKSNKSIKTLANKYGVIEFVKPSAYFLSSFGKRR